jgi:hypothetical protein
VLVVPVDLNVGICVVLCRRGAVDSVDTQRAHLILGLQGPENGSTRRRVSSGLPWASTSAATYQPRTQGGRVRPRQALTGHRAGSPAKASASGDFTVCWCR